MKTVKFATSREFYESTPFFIEGPCEILSFQPIEAVDIIEITIEVPDDWDGCLVGSRGKIRVRDQEFTPHDPTYVFPNETLVRAEPPKETT